MTPAELLTVARSLWKEACGFDGIDPDSKFVVFSDGNKFAEFYNTAMHRYFASLAR
jgi:hypothetical protein